MNRALRLLRRRAVGSIPVLLIVVVLTFLLLEAAAGDAVDAYLLSIGGGDAAIAQSLRASYGLDQSMAARLWLYLSSLARLDLGWSVAFDRPVRDLILERPQIIVQLAIPMTVFFWGIFGVVFLAGWKLGFNYEDAVAVAFNSTGRDFEIAIAIAITAFNPTVALATVVGPLIEVPVMLALVWMARQMRERLFVGTTEAVAEPAD